MRKLNSIWHYLNWVVYTLTVLLNNIMLLILALTLNLGAELVFAERNFNDKTVLVTGAARGIGYSIADNMLENGAKLVIIVDKNGTSGPLAAETLRCKYGEDKVVFLKGDVRTDLDDIYEDVLENYGCTDILVNNAGIITKNDPDIMMNTNAVAVVNWSLKFRDLMRTDQSSKCGKGGLILNVASVAGHMAYPFLYVYASAKSAVIGLTRCLGHRYNEKQTNVSVVALCPGATHTNMTEKIDFVEKFQEEDFLNNYYGQEWQAPDAVGSAAVEIYKNAESGTVWDVVGGSDPYLASSLTIFTVEDIVAWRT